MAGTTSNLGLYLPGGGSTGAYTPDEVADIDRLNENFVKIDVANGNKQYYGPAAGVSAITGMRVGDRHQESDAGFRTRVFDGVQWVPTLASAVNTGADYGPAEAVMVSTDMTVVAGRMYRITAHSEGTIQGGGPGLVQVRVRVAPANTELFLVLSRVDVPNTYVVGHGSLVWTAPSAGTMNFQLNAAAAAGFAFRCAAGRAQISVEPCY